MTVKLEHAPAKRPARAGRAARRGPGLLALLVLSVPSESTPAQAPPYPPSPAIADVRWDFSKRIRRAPGSDLWPITWAADGHLYTAWGDGGGFGGTNTDGRVSLGFARITGAPGAFAARNVWGGKDAEHPAAFGGKVGGLLSIDGVLYAWVNMQNAEPPEHRLAWSAALGASWRLAPWSFSGKGDFFPVSFLNFGRDYAGARDGFVYVYGGRWRGKRPDPRNLYLARVPKTRLRERQAYEFFAGVDDAGRPAWRAAEAAARPVFTDPNGVGHAALAHVVYNAPLGRYLLTVGHGPPGGGKPEIRRLGLFDAPEPWGPWTTVAYYDDWGGLGTGLALGYVIPAKWIAPDGRRFWMIFSSTGALDAFNLVPGRFVLR